MAWLSWIFSKIFHLLSSGKPAPVYPQKESPRVKGGRGELRAKKYLVSKGYKIQKRNFAVRGGEIDIIAKNNDTIVFVEVKACSSVDFEDPLAWIPSWKQDKIVRASAIYLKKYGITGTAVRFDVVTLSASGEINHIKDAFRPSNRFFM